MVLIPFESDGCFCIAHDLGVWKFKYWPRNLQLNDLLQALCGAPGDDRGYVCHEDMQWMERSLRMVSLLNSQQVASFAISNHGDMPDAAPVSFQAAVSIAIVLLERAFGASREDVKTVVHMNVGSVGSEVQ